MKSQQSQATPHPDQTLRRGMNPLETPNAEGGATTAVADSPLLGATISVTSTSQIRYEGVLSAIDQQEATVSLQHVQMCGTEGRRGGQNELAPNPTAVYSFIKFRASDIVEMQVLTPTPAPPTATAPTTTPPTATSNAKDTQEQSTVDRRQRQSCSERIRQTDDPCIVAMQDMLQQAPPDTVSLSQGIVFWTPPKKALDRATAAIHHPGTSAYCSDAGLVPLRQALQHKIKTENNLTRSTVMVTQGANQAFVNIVLALCDPEDRVVLFPPYYFNHKMALQMTIAPENIVLGERDARMVPSLEWITRALQDETVPTPKMIVIANPDNPTGTVMDKEVGGVFRALLFNTCALFVVFSAW